MADVLDEMGFQLWLLLLDVRDGELVQLLRDCAVLHARQDLSLKRNEESVCRLLLLATEISVSMGEPNI